jgi:ABC-type dipeptide/oligopeptide/nickel transport system permease component
MLDVVKQDFVRTARAKGVRDVAVLMRHAFRNSLLPIVTILGLQVGYMLGGSVIVESVFAWPGMGSLVVEAAIRRDYPTVQGALLVYAFLIALVNLLVDTLYVVLDPRVRYG